MSNVAIRNTTIISQYVKAERAPTPVFLKINVHSKESTRDKQLAYASFIRSTELEYLRTPEYVLKILAPTQLNTEKNSAEYRTAYLC